MRENYDVQPVLVEQQYDGGAQSAPIQQASPFDPATVPSASAGTEGKIAIASQGDVNLGTNNTRAVTPFTLKNASFLTKKLAATIGDGSATTIDVAHNFGTRDFRAEVYRNSGNYETIEAADYDLRRPDINTARFVFTSAPAFHDVRVVIWT